jgi:hypothetical protein
VLSNLALSGPSRTLLVDVRSWWLTAAYSVGIRYT